MPRTSPATVVALLTACLLAGMLLVARPAAAGVATIYQCRGPQGPAATDLMSASGNPAMTLSLYDCRDQGAFLLSSASAGANWGVGYKTLTFAAPGSTRFAGGTLYRQMDSYAYVSGGSTSVDSWGFGYKLMNAESELLERCGAGEGVASVGDCGPAYGSFTGAKTQFATGSKVLPARGTTSYSLTVGCLTADRCKHYYNGPGLHHISAALRVQDDAAPSIDGVSGPLATADPVRPGNTEVSVSASDHDGLGVYRAAFLVDDQVVQRGVFSDNGGTCKDADPADDDPYEFASGHPCPEVAPTKTFNLSTLPEGEHSLKVTVEDAAGNTVVAMSRLVTIDLVPPPSNTGAPIVAGTAEAGRTLSAEPGSWDVHGGSPVGFSYTWQRCDAAATTCTTVPGATSPLYDLGAGDVGSRLRAVVIAANSDGQALAASAATPVVSGAPAPGGGDGQGGGGQGGGGAGDGNDPPAPLNPDLGPDLRRLGTPNGTNATERVVLSAFESTTERRRVRVRYGRPVTISGRVLAPGGIAVAGARVEVLARDRRAGAPMRHQVDVLTGADGRFHYVAPPGMSRTIRLGYRARVGDTTFARTTDVDVRVVASVAFRLSRKRLRNGQALRYAGRLRGPGTGHRFVEVQVRNGRAWQIVCSVRTDARGAFACRHRFRRTYRPTTYAFRARVRKQTGMAYEAGCSSARRARVRP